MSLNIHHSVESHIQEKKYQLNLLVEGDFNLVVFDFSVFRLLHAVLSFSFKSLYVFFIHSYSSQCCITKRILFALFINDIKQYM